LECWSGLENAQLTCSKERPPGNADDRLNDERRLRSEGRHNVAHGARPILIGKNLISIKDQDGKYLIQEMIELAKDKGGGWIEYKWPHPTTNKIEDKTSYIEKMGDYFVGVGVRPPRH
jgi:hypothetical protein